MERNVFRKKSIESMSSPEQLNDYIRICNPSLWSVLAAVIFLLFGAIVWGVFGHLDTTLHAACVCENGKATVYVKAADMDAVMGKRLSVNEREYTVEESMRAAEPISIGQELSDYARRIGNLTQGEWAYALIFETDMPNGVYEATIITESVPPISFVFN